MGDAISNVGRAWVHGRTKQKRDGAKGHRWVITKTTAKSIDPSASIEKPKSVRYRHPDAVRKARRRQDELEQHLEKRRSVSLGCAPLNGDASDEVAKRGRVSYGSIVDGPPSTSGQTGSVRYKSRRGRS